MLGFGLNFGKYASRPAQGNQQVSMSLVASRTSCTAMGGIVFDATGTTMAGVDAFADLLYLFDFGDAASGNYANGVLAGKSKQFYAGGPVAAHVYEHPGSYTASMWVFDGTTMHGPVTQAVTITDPDTVYAGALTTVVSTDGDFTGSPAGATQVTSSNFATAMATYGLSNRRVLFKAGQSFTAAASTLLSSARSNLYVGSFGGGAKPDITATTNSISILAGLANGSNAANNAKNWNVTGLSFKATPGITGVIGVNPGPYIPAGADITLPLYAPFFTIHNCDFEGCLAPANIAGGGNVRSKLTVANVAHGVATSGGVALYSSNAYLCATLDCSANNAGGGEHVLRAQAGIKQQFASNDLLNPAATKHYLTIRGSADYVSTDICAEYNKILGASNTTAIDWAVQVAPNSVGANEQIDRATVRWNYIDANQKCQTACIIEAKNVTVAGNVFRFKDMTQAGAIGVSVVRPGGSAVPASDGIRIYDNTFDYESALGFTAVTMPSALVVNTKVKGNIAWAPNAIRSSTTGTDGPKFLTGLATVDAANNSTDSQVKNTTPLFNGATSAVAGFKLQVGSPYRDAGLDLKVHIDALGFVREVGGQFDAGAMNSTDKQSDVWGLIP
jgi:hypothetical protein